MSAKETSSKVQPGMLYIPDISGFTKFVRNTDIIHSQHIIQELLETRNGSSHQCIMDARNKFVIATHDINQKGMSSRFGKRMIKKKPQIILH